MLGSKSLDSERVGNEIEGADAKEVLTSIRANTIISSGVRANNIMFGELQASYDCI
jgi:hypothetical protein